MGFQEWRERRKEARRHRREELDAVIQMQERYQRIYNRLRESRLETRRAGYYVNEDPHVGDDLLLGAQEQDTTYHAQLEKFVLETDTPRLVEMRRRNQGFDLIMGRYEVELLYDQLDEPRGPLGTLFGVRTST